MPLPPPLLGALVDGKEGFGRTPLNRMEVRLLKDDEPMGVAVMGVELGFGIEVTGSDVDRGVSNDDDGGVAERDGREGNCLVIARPPRI